MQFTSPLFIFIFLPLMTVVPAILPARLRRRTILAVGVAFYILANIKTPVSILFLAVVAAFAYCASYAVYVNRKRKKRTLLIFSVSICIGMLALLRYLGVRFEAYDVSFLPLGMSIYMLSAVSMIIDVSRGDSEPPATFADALTYIGFFPVMIAGPIVKYKDFGVVSSDDNLDISLKATAEGGMLFARGFVKRIGISAILSGAYDEISAGVLMENKLQIWVGLFLMFLMLANVYFAFSGYSDMGRGLALIMGVRLSPDFNFPLAACTPFEYLRRFMISFNSYVDDYFALPIERVFCRGMTAAEAYCDENGISTYNGSGGMSNAVKGISHARDRAAALIAGTVAASLTALWFKASLAALLAFAPLILLSAWERAAHIGNDERNGLFIRRNLATRLLGRICTGTLVGLFWLQIKLRYVSQLFDYIGMLTVVGSYQPYKIYLTIYNREYLWVLFVTLWLMQPALLRNFRNKHGWDGERYDNLRGCIYYTGILLFFVFSVFVILPQHPEYSLAPFKYITF